MPDKKTFEELGLAPELLASIAALGFEAPTPVQEAVIPRLLESSQDVVGLAQTGTGKTAAFGLPCIQQVDVNSGQTQVLILCPTRELCLQITRDLASYGKHTPGVRSLAVYGGSSIVSQINALRRGAHIIVATPGRIHDLLRRRSARLEHVQRVILDEADEMLNMGFKEDLQAILEQVPDTAQTLLFSATMPRQVEAIAGNFMTNPEVITIGKRNAGAENVTHVCYTVRDRDRYLALKRIADFYPEMYGIVFCRTRVDTQQVADMLVKDGYDADALHGDLNQTQRDRVMDRFRRKNLQMLVATDVAARGLDVTDLTHIINYALPDDLELYTHRSGRTGRAGRGGISVVIVRRRDRAKIRRVEQLMKKKFEFRDVPVGEQVCEAQLLALMKRVKGTAVDHEQLDTFMPRLQELLEGMSRDDLIKQFVSLEFNRILEYYRGARDLNVRETQPTREKRNKRVSDFNFKKLFINMGKKDRLSPKKLMELINNVTPGRSVEIGHIDIRHTHSFFEVEVKAAAKVVNSLMHADFNGKDLQVMPVEESADKRPGQPKERRPFHHGFRGGGGSPPRRSHSAGRGKKRKPGKPKGAVHKGKSPISRKRPTGKK